MTVSPLDYRYGRPEAKDIWSREGRHTRQLDVERALVWAHCQLGRVSAEHYDKIADISDPGIVTADRVDEIEAETRHDIMALTKAMAEQAGEAAWCIHLGATSNDVHVRFPVKVARHHDEGHGTGCARLLHDLVLKPR